MIDLFLLGGLFGAAVSCFAIVYFLGRGGVQDEVEFPLEAFEEAAETC